jgi:hypothetical protein
MGKKFFPSKTSFYFDAVLSLLLHGGFGVVFLILIWKNRRKWKEIKGVWRRYKGPFLLLIVTIGLKLALYSLVGYSDPRYHLESFMLFVAIFFVLAPEKESSDTSRVYQSVFWGVPIFILSILVLSPFLESVPFLGRMVPRGYATSFENISPLDYGLVQVPQEVSEIRKKVLEVHPEVKEVLFLAPQAFSFGAFTSIRTYTRPIFDPEDDLAKEDFIRKRICPDIIITSRLEDWLAMGYYATGVQHEDMYILLKDR